jgi:hypothetical protein
MAGSKPLITTSFHHRLSENDVWITNSPWLELAVMMCISPPVPGW